VNSVAETMFGPRTPEQIRTQKAIARAAEAKAAMWNTLAGITVVLAFVVLAAVPAVLSWLYTVLL
jgi:hypothetical protein